ncbi:MAG: 2-amino-4-hydroxy-6-hydroxymethyldihydropteridine diphosphokinase [Anaerolineae bacterium]|nr:MAG: 2-amino-4-hydroxy-6-hydroxymethyldihydropteridine diphosphokinase [Anaerolineae bacterium]
MSGDGSERRVCIVLGSNIQPERHLRLAVEGLRVALGPLMVSSAWRTPAVGAPGPDFLNACVAAPTTLSATALKFRVLRPLEAQLGRVRNEDKNAPRVIDLDLILDDGVVLDPDVWTHEHLALPLAELEPTLRNPQTGETLAETASRLEDRAARADILLQQ